MQNIGDTKAGTLVGTDRWGNKFYENITEDLPLRVRSTTDPPLLLFHGCLHVQTRWVDYKDYEKDPSQIDPGWHAWISYMVDTPPTEDKLLEIGRRPWDDKTARVNYTLSRAAYRPYSTYVPNALSGVDIERSEEKKRFADYEIGRSQSMLLGSRLRNRGAELLRRSECRRRGKANNQ